MTIVRGLLNFIYDFLRMLGTLYEWLSTPLYTLENIPVGYLIIEKLGIDISFIYNLTPLAMLSTFLVAVLTTVLIAKFVGMILDAIPVI